MSGQPPKHPSKRKLEGNPSKRPIPEIPEVAGAPVKPADLSKEASKYWDEIIDEITRFGAGAVDSQHIASMCEMYALYKATLTLLQKDPCNAKARITFNNAWANWHRACVHYGISSVARVRLAVEPDRTGSPKADEDPLVKLGIVS